MNNVTRDTQWGPALQVPPAPSGWCSQHRYAYERTCWMCVEDADRADAFEARMWGKQVPS